MLGRHSTGEGAKDADGGAAHAREGEKGDVSAEGSKSGGAKSSSKSDKENKEKDDMERAIRLRSMLLEISV